MFKKNTSVTGFTVGFINATTGAPVTTGTPAGYYTLDGGTQTAIAGAFTHEGNGQWSVNLAAGEMNGTIVGLVFTLANAVNVYHTIKTVLIDPDNVNGIADSILDRDMGAGADSGSPSVRTVRQALRMSRNKVAISGGVLTCYKEDDATASHTATVTTTAGNPISTIDPA